MTADDAKLPLRPISSNKRGRCILDSAKSRHRPDGTDVIQCCRHIVVCLFAMPRFACLTTPGSLVPATLRIVAVSCSAYRYGDNGTKVLLRSCRWNTAVRLVMSTYLGVSRAEPERSASSLPPLSSLASAGTRTGRYHRSHWHPYMTGLPVSVAWIPRMGFSKQKAYQVQAHPTNRRLENALDLVHVYPSTPPHLHASPLMA